MQARKTAWNSLIFLLAMASAAFAQPSKSDKKRGEALYDKAKAAQKKGNCDAAIPQFTEAMGLLGNDFILFDLGQCLQAEGRNTAALHHYLLLNARMPDSPVATVVNEAIAAIESQDERAAYDYYVSYLASSEVQSPERANGEYRVLAEQRKIELAAKHPEWVATAIKDPDKPPTTDPDIKEPTGDAMSPAIALSKKRPGRTKKLVGLGLGVAGLATAAVGGYYGVLRAKDLKDQAADCAVDPACKDTNRLDDLNSTGESYNRRGIILAAVGGAAVVGGAVLFVMGRNDAKRAQKADVAVVPSLMPDGSAMVTLSGRF